MKRTYFGLAMNDVSITQRGVQWAKLPRPIEKFEHLNFTFEVPDKETRHANRLHGNVSLAP